MFSQDNKGITLCSHLIVTVSTRLAAVFLTHFFNNQCYLHTLSRGQFAFLSVVAEYFAWSHCAEMGFFHVEAQHSLALSLYSPLSPRWDLR